MNRFIQKSVLFWFVLLVIAIGNAILRELTYKPLLSPYIGMWAHQISSVIGIILFYFAIRIYLTRVQEDYSKKEVVHIGIIWLFMTLLFETGMNIFIRKLDISEVLRTYYFWEGETWIFVLVSLLVLPTMISKRLQSQKK